MHAIRVLSPDVIFINLDMTQTDGLQFAKTISTDKYILVITNINDCDALEASKLGATEYLIEPISAEHIAAITPKIEKTQNMLQLYNSTCAPHGHVVQCFGAFTVLTPEFEPVKWPTRKVEELFAYFLVHFNQVVNKWRLAEDLWPNKGLHNIHNGVYLCNKVLKQYDYPLAIERINDGYRLQVNGDVMIDLTSFQALEKKSFNATTCIRVDESCFNEWCTFCRQRLSLGNATPRAIYLKASAVFRNIIRAISLRGCGNIRSVNG